MARGDKRLRPDYDPEDQGEFEEGLVFVIMPF
jgi:hypothetical protein